MNSNGSIKSSLEISKGKNGLPQDFTSASMEGFSNSIAGIGDLDKDGVNDIVVGNHGLTTTFQGEIYILNLNKNGTVKKCTRIAEDLSGFNGQLDPRDDFGRSVCSIGDIDKDGVSDLAVGAVEDNDFGTLTGAVWILFLKTDGTVKSYKKLHPSSLALSDLHKNEGFGQGIASLGDFNKDGVNDIVVTSYSSISAGFPRGSARLIFLNSDGSIKKVSKINQTSGNFNDSLTVGGQFGWAVASLGDLDGDTIVDISVSCIGNNDHKGALWNIFLKGDGTCKSIQKITTDTGGFKATLKPGDVFGTSLTSLGDLNKDGITDMISDASSDGEAGTNAGAFYILFLNGKPQIYIPVASFTQSKDTIKLNECVNFTDKSTNTPTNWKWTFQGGNPATSTQQNPSNICFSKAGKYTITLIAGNSKGSDTSTKTLVVKAPVGVEAINYSPVKISPNPFFNSTAIQTDKFLNNAILTVYNTQGQLVRQIKNVSGNEISFQRGNLPGGLYFINLSQEPEFFTAGKLMITD